MCVPAKKLHTAATEQHSYRPYWSNYHRDLSLD